MSEAYQRLLVPTLFSPWAQLLLDRAAVVAGDSVLDVATGTGVVAAAALERVGSSGRVVAADISPGMLEYVAAAVPAVQTVLAPAADLAASGDFDAVLCQQGLQFMPDRVAAVTAMRGALRPGGTVAVAVWERGRLLEPFDVYGQALEAEGVPEPFPGAYIYDFNLPADELAAILSAAGLRDVTVSVETLAIVWPSIDVVVAGIAGTPYGPALASLPDDRQQRVAAWLRERLRVSHPGVVAVGRGTAPDR